jgi:hypothetical protein
VEHGEQFAGRVVLATSKAFVSRDHTTELIEVSCRIVGFGLLGPRRQYTVIGKRGV